MEIGNPSCDGIPRFIFLAFFFIYYHHLWWWRHNILVFVVLCTAVFVIPCAVFSLELMCRQSILEYNGAAILAMTGKNCVGICSDSRLGNQAQTVATDFEKIFKMGDQLMVGGDGSSAAVCCHPSSLGGMSSAKAVPSSSCVCESNDCGRVHRRILLLSVRSCCGVPLYFPTV